MNLLVVTGHYPSRSDPARGVFVKNTVAEMTRLGLTADVIAPLPFRFGSFLTGVEPNLKNVTFSRFFKVPAKLMGLNLFSLKQFFFTKSVVSSYSQKSKEKVYDAVYAHFLFPAGDAALA